MVILRRAFFLGISSLLTLSFLAQLFHILDILIHETEPSAFHTITTTKKGDTTKTLVQAAYWPRYCQLVDIPPLGHSPFGLRLSARWTTTPILPLGLPTTVYRLTKTMTRPGTEAK